MEKMNEINDRLAPFYEASIFRRIQVHSCIGSQSIEIMMQREFIGKFGSGEAAFVVTGDWDQHQHLKFNKTVQAANACGTRIPTRREINT